LSFRGVKNITKELIISFAIHTAESFLETEAVGWWSRLFTSVWCQN